MKDFKLNIIGFIVIAHIIFLSFLLFFSVRRTTNSKEEEEPASRIEVIEERSIDKYYNYKIIVDRETDVEYLIIQKPGDGIGITIMRDSGGMVKLRE